MLLKRVNRLGLRILVRAAVVAAQAPAIPWPAFAREGTSVRSGKTGAWGLELVSYWDWARNGRR
jgi:hypothetical protein